MQAILVLLVLHVVTSMRYGFLGDDPWSGSWWMINPDLLVVLAVGCLSSLRFGYRSLVGHACVLAILVVVLYRVPLVVTQAYFRAELRLFDNLEYLFGTWILVANSEPAATQIAILAGGILGVTLVWTLLYVGVRVVLRRATEPWFTFGVVAFAQLFAVVAWAEASARPDQGSRFAGPSMLAPLSREVLEIMRVDAFAEEVTETAASLAKLPKTMAGLRGADVYILFVESYGRLLFEHPEHRGRIADLCTVWSGRLKEAGFESVTSFIRSPSFGGKSQAAHATLMTGVRVHSYGELRALERGGALTLPRILVDVGYAAINCQPKLDREWPASAGFYGFTKDLFGKDLPYLEEGGFCYPWAPAPDQYCLQFALDKLIQKSPDPVFMQFVSTTSHVPFSWIPPYHENWSVAGEPAAHQPVAHFDFTALTYAMAPDKDEAFLKSMDYSLNTVFGFVLQLQRPSLVFILGDHQPARLCEIEGRDPSWDVPIHALTNRPALLAPLHERGFVEGLVPARAEAFAMREFLVKFLSDYGR